MFKRMLFGRRKQNPEPTLQGDSLKILPSPHLMLVEKFLIEHIRNVNLLRKPTLNQLVPDQEFSSNEDFWKSFITGQAKAMCWVKLNNFRITDWYPRSPGLFYTENAKWHRQQSERYRREENGVVFLEPYGKINMIEGGLGSIRFKTQLIDGEMNWLCTATSDTFCHSGIPLAISEYLMRQIDLESGSRFTITGQVCFLPDSLQPRFSHVLRIPQIYVRIEKVEEVSKDFQPIFITPMVFFTNSERRDHVTYMTCHANDFAELDRAANWLEWYATKYEGEIITNFDEQRPTFDTAPFSLQKLMTYRTDSEYIQKFIGYDINIYTDGGAFINGDVSAGGNFTGRDAKIS